QQAGLGGSHLRPPAHAVWRTPTRDRSVRVVVVGVGALGSHVVQLGRSLPVQWKVIDDDRIEAKNLLAQFHTRLGVGKNKAQALQQAMQGMFGVKIEAIPHRLTADNTEALLGDAD